MNEPFPLERFKPISKCEFVEHSNDELLAAFFSVASVIGDRVESGEMALDDAPAFASVIHLMAMSKELCEWNDSRSVTS